MEVREDDETFENNVDIAFRELGERDPNHFAVRQWRKYKLAAGKTAKSINISAGARLAPFDIQELREITMYDELELDTLGGTKKGDTQKTVLFLIMSDTDSTFTASVYTYDRRLIKKLDALCRKCPEEVYEEKKRSSAGAKSYIVPKSCVSVREPFSRARREAASRRAKEAGTVPPDRSKGRVSDE